MSLMVMADYDEYGFPKLQPHILLEDIKIRVKSLQYVMPHVGKAILKRTYWGYHVKFPFARLTKDEHAFALIYLQMDSGYVWWAQVREGRQTLRIGEKPIVCTVKSHKVGKTVIKSVPQIIDVIDVE